MSSFSAVAKAWWAVMRKRQGSPASGWQSHPLASVSVFHLLWVGCLLSLLPRCILQTSWPVSFQVILLCAPPISPKSVGLTHAYLSLLHWQCNRKNNDDWFTYYLALVAGTLRSLLDTSAYTLRKSYCCKSQRVWNLKPFEHQKHSEFWNILNFRFQD